MHLKTIDNLKSVYDSVDDIDLYIGCLSESSTPVAGSVLGPTALCIIANQFAIIKNNDRYFYDVTNQISSFSTGIIVIVSSLFHAVAFHITDSNSIGKQRNMKRFGNQRVWLESCATTTTEI